MADLKETAVWEPTIRQLETSDPVMGGENGVSNTAPRQLANRTFWLKNALAAAVADIGNLSAGKASKSITLTAGTGLTGTGDLSANRTFAIDKASAAHLTAGTVNKVLTTDIAKAEFDKQVPYTGATSNLDLNGKVIANVSGIKIGDGKVNNTYQTLTFGNYDKAVGGGNYHVLHNGNYAENQRSLAITTYSESDQHIASIFATSTTAYYRQGENNYALALQKDVASKSITLTAGTGLTGTGDLSANRTFSIDKASAANLTAGTANKVLTTDIAKAEFDKQVPYSGASQTVNLNGQALLNSGDIKLGNGANSLYQAVQMGNYEKTVAGENYTVFHNARYKASSLARYATMSTFDSNGAAISSVWADEIAAYLRLKEVNYPIPI